MSLELERLARRDDETDGQRVEDADEDQNQPFHDRVDILMKARAT